MERCITLPKKQKAKSKCSKRLTAFLRRIEISQRFVTFGTPSTWNNHFRFKKENSTGSFTQSFKNIVLKNLKY